jgi:hypothetical protein
MSKLIEEGQLLLERTRRGAPPLLKHTLMPRLYEFKEFVLPLVKPHLDVYEWHGQGKGGPLTVTCVGLGHGRLHLHFKSVMFITEPEEVAKEPVSVRSPNEFTSVPGSDIIIVTASEGLVRKLPRQNALILPEYVDHILDIQGDWKDVKKRLRRSKSVRGEFSAFERYSYTCETSHDDRDFERHYHTMYVPTMMQRHGDVASLMSKEEARLHFRLGFLLLLKRDGRIVASGLCRDQGEKVMFITLGIVNADEQLLQESVIGALYISLIHWANQRGYEALDFLGGLPYLHLGVFQYKRKWGMTVGNPPKPRNQIWFRFQRDTPAVRQFLKDNPCIVVDDNGDLEGLVVVDDSDNVTPEIEAHWHKRYLTPGMKGLRIRSMPDLVRS